MSEDMYGAVHTKGILGRRIASPNPFQQIVFYVQDAITVSFDCNYSEMFRCICMAERDSDTKGMSHSMCN